MVSASPSLFISSSIFLDLPLIFSRSKKYLPSLSIYLSFSILALIWDASSFSVWVVFILFVSSITLLISEFNDCSSFCSSVSSFLSVSCCSLFCLIPADMSLFLIFTFRVSHHTRGFNWHLAVLKSLISARISCFTSSCFSNLTFSFHVPFPHLILFPRVMHIALWSKLPRILCVTLNLGTFSQLQYVWSILVVLVRDICVYSVVSFSWCLLRIGASRVLCFCIRFLV